MRAIMYLGLMLLASRVVMAQQPAPTVPDVPPSPFEAPNGMLLRPGTVVFDLTSSRAGQLATLGVRTVQVSQTALGGLPAWLITESRTGTAVETSDSLFLTRGELAPERWLATSGHAQLGASFSRDSIFVALQSYQGRSSFALGLGSGTLVTPGMVERIVELLPLRVGYRASASLVIIELGTPRVVSAELLVESDERAAIGQHALDCWIVTLRSGDNDERIWVTKSAARVVKTEQLVRGALLTGIARL